MRRLAAAGGIAFLVCLCPALGGSADGSTLAPPANDNFANAFVLTGQDASRTGDTNVDATLEVGEPVSVAGQTGNASVWYSWTAPVDGQVRIDTLTSDFDTLLGVYTGAAVASLSEVASNDDCCNRLTSRVRFAATAGTTYRIRVDGFDGNRGSINLHLFETQPPPNDDFSASTVLTGQDVSVAGDTNEGATLEPGEPGSVAGVAGGTSVWYSWTAPISGNVTLDAATSTFDTLLGVYTGNAVGALTDVASNDDTKTSVTSLVRFSATAGTVYRIRVDGFDADSGTVGLNLHEVPPPPAPVNDNFADAIVLSGLEAFRTGDTNLGATLETGEPATVAGVAGGTSVWYAWTAPTTDRVRIDTLTSDFDTLLGVYTGTRVGALAEVASSDDELPDLTSVATFQATAGTVYRIRVDGYEGDYGTIDLHLLEGKLDQTIAVTTHAPAGAVFGSSFSVAANASGGTVTYSSAGACSNSGSTFTMTSGTGTCSVMYDQAGSSTYNPAAQVVESVGAAKADQALAVTTHAPAGAVFGSSFSVAATASGGPVSYSSAGACSNSGGTFTMTSGTGACSVMYDQPGSANYNAAARVTETVSAQKADQTISVTAHAPAAAVYQTSFSVAAVASGGPVTYSSAGACSSSGSTFTMTSGTGTCSVMYDQGGNANYNAAPRVVESVLASLKFLTLTVKMAGRGLGSVTSDGGGVSCATPCTTSVVAGTVLNLTASAVAGSEFTGWSGACQGPGTCTMTMDADKTVTAAFGIKTVVQKVVYCVVPNVKGKSLAAARRKIVAAHCRAGRVTTARSKIVTKGGVISQRPVRGKRLRSGSKVDLVVSRGGR